MNPVSRTLIDVLLCKWYIIIPHETVARERGNQSSNVACSRSDSTSAIELTILTLKWWSGGFFWFFWAFSPKLGCTSFHNVALLGYHVSWQVTLLDCTNAKKYLVFHTGPSQEDMQVTEMVSKTLSDDTALHPKVMITSPAQTVGCLPGVCLV